MARMTFVNLPVRDLQRSIEFFEGLGFAFDPVFTDDTASGLILSEGHAYAMLIVEDRFKDFTGKAIADAKTTTEVLVAFSVDRREEVDELVTKAIASGGGPANEPIDEGFMYGWSFEDPDGHIWEPTYMDEAALDG
jgi:uncharacterized protein